MSKGRVLLVSHGITTVTGFANQTYLVGRALIEEGYDVLVAQRDYRGEPIKFAEGTKTESGRDLAGFTMLPWGIKPWGEDKVPWLIEYYKPDIVFTLGDIWCYQYLSQMRKTTAWKWFAQYVFDTENMVSFWNMSVHNADLSIVPSKISYDLTVNKYGHKNVAYIPHGINTDIFRPATAEEKIKFRKDLGLPEDAFIVSCVAHNQQRKMMPRLLEAFRKFAVGKRNIFLLMHTTIREEVGWDLSLIINDWGMKDIVFFTDSASKMMMDVHISEEEMRRLYCASDVHALSTGGEGFGVPIVEAMACGIPNVATAYTTTKEFLCDVKKTNETEMEYTNTRGIAVPYVDIEWHHTGGVWALIDTNKMAEAFQFLYEHPEERHRMGSLAREHAVSNYDSKLIKNKWKEFFANSKDMMDEIRRGEDHMKVVKIGG
jgi:glycosyltransferase involved in cell wall biosynthesis